MKNLFTPLLFVCLWLAGGSVANAQIRASWLSIVFNDQLGNPLDYTPEVYVRNTDSVGFSSYPYIHQRHISTNQNQYTDSSGWDTLFQDTMVSIHYYACGQWNTMDTSFKNAGQAFAYLSVVINIPCIQPCNAFFYTNAALTSFKATFSAVQWGNNLHHTWDFGDGQTDTVPKPQHEYNDTGTYLISHIITNDVSGCADTAWDTVSFDYNCNAHFMAWSPSGHGLYNIGFASSNGPNYQHTWDMGDGNIRTDSISFQGYQYNAIDSFLIRHIVHVPGHCSDTFSLTIFNSQVNCNFDFASLNKSGYTITIVPTKPNLTLTYDFGDGNTYTGTGTVQHSYLNNGNYTVTMWNNNTGCSEKSRNVNISVVCNTAVIPSEDSLFTIRLYNPGYTSGTSIFYFGDGDSAIGDSARHTYTNTAGGYTVWHRIFNGSGHLLCQTQFYLSFNSCGNSNLQPFYDYVHGEIFFDDSLRNEYNDLVVYLIVHDTANATLTLVDSVVVNMVPMDSGYFYFGNLCYPKSTRFLLKAALLSGSAAYADFLPTYADTSVLWSGAITVQPGIYTSINMRRGNNPGGPGFIGGYISQGANKSGAALDEIQVTLLRSDGAPVAYVLSANAGRYEFHNLAYGSYRLLVEIPGKPSQEYAIVLNSANESFDNLDFEVNTMDITTKMTSVQGVAADNLKLYPNPADHSLFIEWSGGQATVEMLDVNGKTWLRADLKEGSGTQKVDVSFLSPGFYFIRINDGNEIRHQLISIK